MSLLEEWEAEWARFYANKREREAINARLVTLKNRLRSSGQPTVQPAMPAAASDE